MDSFQGQVKTVLLDECGYTIAWIDCPAAAAPAPGRYTMAWRSADPDAPLAIPLFASSYKADGFLAVAPASIPWEPGDCLLLRGPLGRGFAIPPGVRRLALGIFSGRTARLSPLITESLQNDMALALFMDGKLPELPAAVEINPLSDFQEALSWADFLALELPLDMDLKAVMRGPGSSPSLLSLQSDTAYLGPPGQVLCVAQMPCGGMADCGVCAVGTGRNWKMACKDGPVFDIREFLKLSD